MKINRSVVWLIAVAIILIAVVLWHGSKHPAPTAVLPQAATTGEPTATGTPPQASNSLPNQTPTASAPQNNALVTPRDKGDQIKEGLSALNDVPIAFYGKLQDQFGNPVIGAQIAASVRIYNGIQSTVDRFATTSDADGVFRINHGKGESLSIMPSKAGYVMATRDTLFKYSYMYPDHFTPNPTRPTVIKMWKLQGAEPLVNFNRSYKLRYSDAPIYFNLVSGEIVPTGGDVKITLNRPAGEVSERNPQKWGIGFEVSNGGFIEASDTDWGITYMAPDAGYQPSGTFDNNNGVGALDKAFFIECRNGQVYSKLNISIGINGKPDGFLYLRFSGVANTNASRNWEATVQR